MSDSDNDWADSDDDVDSLYNIDVESNISRRSSALGGRTQSTGAVNPEAVLNVNEFGPSNIYYVDIESEPAINYEDSYFSYLGGRGPASCPPKESDQVQHSAGLREERSFLDLITAISIIYSEGDYEDMIGLDDVPLDHLDSGADFLVSTTRRSTQSSGRSLPEGIVVKRSRDSQSGSPLQSWEAALFVRELTILHNLRGHPAIPKLRGIGWFYDYLLDVELTPSPKPAILMEKASSTLEGFLRIFQSLPFVTEMRICSDVAKGLQALHSHRLVHGDVKPANVLVFTEDRIESWSGGSRINCKISDFSLSREVGTEDCWFNWGTPLYCAPENKRHLSPQELLLTDVWSLGVLFCRVTQRNLDLHSAGDTAESMATRIHHSVEDSIKDHSSLNAEYSSSWEEEMKAARRGMFQFTIQCDPRNRNLAIVLDILDDYLDAHSEPIEEKPIRITNFKQLYISYNVFEHIGGQVNDAIVLSLEEAIHGSDVRRRAQAYFELAIISISEYACPKFSVKDGLAFLKEAAALDDVRAQGLIYRLEQAILQSEPSSEAEHWLKRAAWLGHEIAMHDIQLIDPTFCTQNRNQSESSQIIGAESVNVMSSRLHLLAATGSTDELERLLQSDPFEIDYQDIEGNTPLILAAKFGNFGSVMRLLKAGAEMTLRNRASENFLHFAGRFSSTQISQILREYAPYLPELLLQSAHGVKQDSYLQIISNPPGTPLERAVAMDSSPAVQALLKGMRLITPPNGRVVRRALLLAIKLNLSSIVKLIMSFIQTHKSDWDPSIPELSRTRWNYQGEVKNFFDALLLGSKACDISPDVPLKWWRYCQLGAQHSNALQEIYVLLAELYKDKTESLLDSAIEDALQERHWDSISAALCWKAEITSGVRKRLTKSLRPLVWMQESVPISPKRRFYRYWFESFSSNLEDFQCYNSCRKEAFQKVDQNYGLNENRDSEPWEVMQSGEDDIRILERPEQRIEYIDQIFYSDSSGTLLHQAIESGDRNMFKLLLNAFGADPALPVPWIGSDHGRIGQINVYNLLALTDHCDIWFAKQFYQSRLGFHHPLERAPWTNTFYYFPLYLAITEQRWAYALWMMRRGASLNDRVLPGRSALEYLLQTENIDLGFLQFLFPLNEGNRLFEFLPQKLQKDDGFHIFKLIYDSNQTKDGLSVPVHWAGAWLDYIAIEIHLDPNFPFFRIRDSEPNDEWLYLLNDREISTRDQPVHRSEAATCWDYLFDVFPNVPNSLVELREFKFPLIPYITLDSNQHIIYILRYLRAIVRYRYEYRSIISQSIGIDNEHNFELFRVAVTRFRARGDERAHMEPFPEQTWRDVLTVSPLDKLPKSCWHQTWIVAEYGYWPSIWRWVSLNMLLISALGLSTYLTTMPTPFLFRLASAGIHAAHSEPPRSVQGQDYYRAYFQLYVPELYIMADNLRSIGNGLVYVFFLAAKLVVGLLTVSFLGIGIYLTRYAAMGMFQIAGVTHWSIAVIVSGIVVAAPGFIFGPLLSIKWWWEWSM